jgi:hypothetical protein
MTIEKVDVVVVVSPETTPVNVNEYVAIFVVSVVYTVTVMPDEEKVNTAESIAVPVEVVKVYVTTVQTPELNVKAVKGYA